MKRNCRGLGSTSAVLVLWGNSRITQRTQRNKYSFYSSFQINLESATRVCCGGVLPFAFAPIQLPLAPWLISFFLGNTSVSADRTDSDF